MTLPNRLAALLAVLASAAAPASAQLLSLCPPPTTAQFFAWGAGGAGELGDGLDTSSPTPVSVGFTGPIVSAASGASHHLGLACDGSVHAWGGNVFGELGTADGLGRSVPFVLPGLAGVTQVATRNWHSLALLGDGTVQAWGYGVTGALGDGLDTSVDVPQPVPGLANVTAVAAGGFHSLAVDSTDTVWAWGWNDQDQLGFTGPTASVPTSVAALSGLGIDELHAGESFSAALTTLGAVWVWGLDDGQAGTGSVSGGPTAPGSPVGLPPVSALAVGSDHLLALDAAGQVWTWGGNDLGQLGRATPSPSDRATPTVVPGLPPILSLSAGYKYSVAVANDGSIWAWGRNSDGQLGATTGDSAVPVQVGLGTLMSCAAVVSAGYASAVVRNCGGVCPGVTDPDQDNILSTDEGSQLSPPPDTDLGGVPDYLDIDSDNDSLPDCFEAGDVLPGTVPVDTDNDGIADFRDLDSDGDTLPDALEGGLDTDGDGLPDYIDLDSDGDGVPDIAEGPGDLDGDGIPDAQDPDTDGDGIPDLVEGALDVDGDGLPNVVDLDSDGDGIPDAVEGFADTDTDGVPDFTDLDSDADGVDDADEHGVDVNVDGIVDAFEAAGDTDTDGDGLPNFRDLDSDGDGIPGLTEGAGDPDGDGVPSFLDADSDGDGLADAWEGLDDDDGDNIPDYLDLDSDGDGIPDAVEGTADTDGDGIPDVLDLDSDGDGIPDGAAAVVDANGDGVPDGPEADLDGDGIPDYLDDDADGDGISNEDEGAEDGDGDGIPDYLDQDADGDGISDADEGDGDLDGDGTPDYQDTDADEDGVADSEFGLDTDGTPVNPDLDGDGVLNHLDDDADGDGIPNDVEGMDDADGDGMINPLDLDSDADGLTDEQEGTDDLDGDGVPAFLDPNSTDGPLADGDGDGIVADDEATLSLDPFDPDTDADGIPDGVEASVDDAPDTDGDGDIDALDFDSDGDGLSDREEAGFDPTVPRDTDGDGTPDFRDLDSDGDGLSDADEVRLGTSWLRSDSDNDGISDGDEVDAGTDPRGTGVAPDWVEVPGEEQGCGATVSGRGAPGGAAMLLGLGLLGLGRRRRPRLLLLAVAALLVACPEGDDDDAPGGPDLPPTVEAAEDVQADEETAVVLTATASDAEGPIAAWRWEQAAGPEVALFGAESRRADFVAPTVLTEATLEFTVTVTDTAGATASDSVSVTVSPVNHAPTVEAGPGRWVTAGDEVVVAADVVDRDGEVATLTWSQTEGTEAALMGTDTATLTLVAPDVAEQEALVFELVAVDNEGGEGSDTVTVTVNPASVGANRPPTAWAGADAGVPEQSVVNLTGAASDPDGLVASTAWTQVSGTTVSLTGDDTLTPSFTAPVATASETLVFQLVVTDDDGATAGDDVAIVVQPVNVAPQVSAGPDQAVSENVSVQLTGTATDADGSVASTTWTQVSGPAAPPASPGALTTLLTAPSVASAETLVYRLTAIDDEGASASDTVQIVVSPVGGGNVAPTVSAGPDQATTSGQGVLLAGTASDPDGTIDAFSWTQISGPAVTLLSTGTAATGFTAPAVAAQTTLVFRLTVTDDAGGVSYDDVTVTVGPADPTNTAPTADAGVDQTAVGWQVVQLAGAGADPDGTIAGYSWLQAGGTSATLSSSTVAGPSFTAPDPAATETLTFLLTVTDDDGAQGVDAVTIEVSPAGPNTAPTADAGPDQWVTEATTATLAGIGTDADGTIASYAWARLSGPVVTLSSAGAASPTFTAPTVATQTPIVFELTVTDDDGATGTDTVTVTVNPAILVNTPPTADAGLDASVDEGDPAVLDGTGSSDPDGAITAWLWTQTAGPTATLTDDTTATATAAIPLGAAGQVLTFQLAVTDNSGATTTDTVDITALPGNQPPVADAGPGQIVPIMSTVTLDATGSSDPDGTLVSYDWVQIDGPPTVLSDHTAPVATFTAFGAVCQTGWTFRLTVTDDEGLAATDVVSIGIDASGSPAITPGTLIDFEADDGGFTTNGTEWEYGVPTSGPSGAESGANVWATKLGAKLANNAVEYLYPPPFDISTTTNPTMSVRVWSTSYFSDGLSLEVWDDAAELWVQLPATPAYTGTDAAGLPAWTSFGYQHDARVEYDFVAASLVGYGTTTRACVRFVYRTNNIGATWGAYLDDFGFADESDDPDNDGLVGILTEYNLAATDPWTTDTDADGATDGAEVAASDDPLDPAQYPGAPQLTPPALLDFEAGDGGAKTPRTLWELGLPTDGPDGAYSGASAWGTNLDGNAFDEAREALYLPTLDLTAAVNPTLSFRLWSEEYFSDGTSVEVKAPGGTWTNVAANTPLYNATDDAGQPAWGDIGYRFSYALAAVSLAPYVGAELQVRVMFRSNGNGNREGAYIDDVRLDEESSDPDGDGLLGVLTELNTYGTDPHVADTDGDGDTDGAEVTAGFDPLDPAQFAAAVVWTPPMYEDLETGDGGLATDRTLWAYGTPTEGPEAAFSGANVWATNLTGNAFGNAVESLYLPTLDLTAAVDPTLSFRLWASTYFSDGTIVEVKVPGGSWTTVTPDTPAYNTTAEGGVTSWGNIFYRFDYELAAISLAPYIGAQLQVRLTFLSNGIGGTDGPHIDDIRLDEESVDTDGDGIVGVLDELLLHGTDPYLADTDGDGDADGAEVAGGFDPLDPAQGPSATVITPPALLTFEAGPDGAATEGTLWAHGAPTSGPQTAYSGTDLWATNLSGNAFSNAVEYLYLPTVDLTAAVDPSLSFRMWTSSYFSDFLTMQINVGGTGWVALPMDTPIYDDTNDVGAAAWTNVRYQDEFTFTGTSLAPYVGSQVQIRFEFRTNHIGGTAGAYIDDVRIDEEATDPDLDGVVGVLDEYLLHGTDPFVADTDGDGDIDGLEVTGGYDPLDPAQGPSATIYSPPMAIDFEATPEAGTTGDLWAWGTPTNGPGSAYSGTGAWATNLTGNAFGGAVEYLYLPTLDLAGTTDPTLSFRLWMRSYFSDYLTMEVNENGAGWVHLPVDEPAYTTTTGGVSAWASQRNGSDYVFAGISLVSFIGSEVQIRLKFITNTIGATQGAYVDDLGADEEASDPDADGIPGVLDEFQLFGTDPFDPDTDGDGVNDGAEVTNGTNPTDPTSN